MARSPQPRCAACSCSTSVQFSVTSPTQVNFQSPAWLGTCGDYCDVSHNRCRRWSPKDRRELWRSTSGDPQILQESGLYQHRCGIYRSRQNATLFRVPACSFDRLLRVMGPFCVASGLLCHYVGAACQRAVLWWDSLT